MLKNKQDIKDTIISCMRESTEFPAMSNTIKLINQFKNTDDISISDFANVILKDYALTARILKLVNSVHYIQFGEVTTISRAIILLGFENIRNFALTLVLFKYLEKKKNVELKDMILKSLCSGTLSQKIANETYSVNSEEAFICALFHTFGRVMLAFYLPERYTEIINYSKSREVSEDFAALSVLGISFEEIGMIVAENWNFPHKIIQGMRKMHSSEITEKASDIDKLCSISTLSNEIFNILSTNLKKEKKDEKIGSLVEDFRAHFGPLSNRINGMINSSLQDMSELFDIFNFDFDDTPFIRQLSNWSSVSAISPPETQVETGSLKTIDGIIGFEKDSPEVIFTKGIQDTNNAILNNYSLNDVVRIVVETMFRGMKLSKISKVLFFVKDTKLPVVNVRFGFGEGVEDARMWFKIPIGGIDDIFNIAITKQNDFVIKDINASDIKNLLPEWYKNRVSSQIFVIILPIIIDKKPLGLFYLEGEREGFQNVTAGHLNYLKILRDQTVLCIKHKE